MEGMTGWARLEHLPPMLSRGPDLQLARLQSASTRVRVLRLNVGGLSGGAIIRHHRVG
jgi:hypothetical protein